MAFADMKKTELSSMCADNGLDNTGTKAELIARLEEAEISPSEEVNDSIVKELVRKSDLPPRPDMTGFDMEMEGTAEFISALYLHIFEREVDTPGLQHYTMILDEYKTLTREQVLDDLVGSDEYRLKVME